jgi:hypothetical protein
MPERPNKTSRRRRTKPQTDSDAEFQPAALSLLSAVALLLVVAGLVLQWRRGNLSVGIDFYQFWLGGQAVREHRAGNLYTPYGRETLAEFGRMRAALSDAGPRLRLATRLRSNVETFSTPFLYSVFAMFGRNYELSYQLYRALSLLAVCIAVLLLGRSARLQLHWSLFILAFVLLLYQPLESEVRVANVNAVQLVVLAAGGALMTSAEAPKLQAAAGALFAIATAFKPNLMLVVPLVLVALWFSRDGRRAAIRHLLGAVGGAVGAITVSCLLFGSWRCWLQWRIAASELATTVLPRASGNVAPLLPWIRGSGLHAPAIAAVLLAGVTIAALIRSGKRRTAGPRILQITAGAAVLVYLLTANLVWLHYLLLALPSAVALLAAGPGEQGSHTIAVRVATLLALSALAIDPWSFALRVPQAVVAPIGVTVGLVILFVLSVAEISSARVRSAS